MLEAYKEVIKTGLRTKTIDDLLLFYSNFFKIVNNPTMFFHLDQRRKNVIEEYMREKLILVGEVLEEKFLEILNPVPPSPPEVPPP